jgi:hypothetical protein
MEFSRGVMLGSVTVRRLMFVTTLACGLLALSAPVAGAYATRPPTFAGCTVTFTYSDYPAGSAIGITEKLSVNGTQVASKPFSFTPSASGQTRTDTMPITQAVNGDTVVATATVNSINPPAPPHNPPFPPLPYTVSATTTGPLGCPVPTIATTASASVPAGGAISDTAVLSGGTSPTGTITFKLYAAGDTTCSTPLSTSTVPVSGDGSYASAPVTENSAGSYQWTAGYSGDPSNPPVAEACGQPAEQVTVPRIQPTMVTSASGGTSGTSLSDTATLSGGTSPTGTITFNLFGPGDPTCSSTPLSSSTVAVAGNNSYTSPAVPETGAGVYQYSVTYSGDANNVPAAEPCGALGESVTVNVPNVVTPVKTTIATTASPSTCKLTPTSRTCKISDTATLSGGNAQAPPTGTITFSLYALGDSACSTALTTDTVVVHGDGKYASPVLTESTAPGYQWVASYGGDANNLPSAELCGQKAEQTAVAKVVGPVCTKPQVRFTSVGYTYTAHVLGAGVVKVTLYVNGTKVKTVTKAHNGVFSVTVDEAQRVGRYTLLVKVTAKNARCDTSAQKSFRVTCVSLCGGVRRVAGMSAVLRDFRFSPLRSSWRAYRVPATPASATPSVPARALRLRR